MRALMLLLAFVFNAAYAGEFSGKVIAVLDGDTVLVLRNNKPVKIRLAEIDAPEKAQDYGMASKASLSGMVLNKVISVNVQAADNYGRLVAHLTADGKSVNEEQLRRGMAWEYSNYHSNKTYIALQTEAQNAKRGLWAQANPTEPSQWRKAHATDAPPAKPIHAATPRMLAAGDYTCGSKQHCAQMRSCGEAHFYLTHCGVKSLDHDGDGVPCEGLCGGKK